MSQSADSANPIRVERYSAVRLSGCEKANDWVSSLPSLSGIIPAHNPRKSCGAAETSRSAVAGAVQPESNAADLPTAATVAV